VVGVVEGVGLPDEVSMIEVETIALRMIKKELLVEGFMGVVEKFIPVSKVLGMVAEVITTIRIETAMASMVEEEEVEVVVLEFASRFKMMEYVSVVQAADSFTILNFLNKRISSVLCQFLKVKNVGIYSLMS
jgi:hypothetical protein